MPSMGIVGAYGGKSPEFYNAFGFYLLGMFTSLYSVLISRLTRLQVWSILNFFFFLASLAT